MPQPTEATASRPWFKNRRELHQVQSRNWRRGKNRPDSLVDRYKFDIYDKRT
ncbi:MAG: hypothetical protein ACD_43C00172G0004 [uncultured bacterium]|nr:MAG: hypothetical protein ACD_43C00172G0004 [uncultured bacterium]